ncbi:MAG: beta-N-acetylhexosaminidase [Clostridia bacterium]|nr:beta-N-acetylhexosaminidase [Clostridia bacterium]
MQNFNKEYTHFGVMLDCSRNAVMKVSEVKRFIDCLQKMGYNTLQLYTEDTYEIKGEPYFGYLRGRYTGAEIKEIDAYALSRGVELIPCVQTLAHFTNLVRHGLAYGDIVDVHDILLVDEPKTYELIDKIFATLAENFTSRLVNIGMDEAHMVGLGKYLQKHGYQNRFDILLRHLQKVVAIAKKYGFTPHMWSDMFFRLATGGNYYINEPMDFPEGVVEGVPEEIELAYWDYYNTDKKIYDLMFDMHAKFNRKLWFAGGAWSWNGFAPINSFSLQTMKPAMESVIEHGVKDVFITMWGDDGAECSVYGLLPSLYAIRQYADGNFDEKNIQKGFYELFKMKYEDFMLLDLPNRFSYETPKGNVPCICKSFLYMDPFLGWLDQSISEQRAIPYGQYADDLKKAAKRVGEYGYIFESLSALCSVLEIKTELGIKTRRAYQSNDKKTLAALVKEYVKAEKRVEAFHTAFYALWDEENKPQGWEVQDARIGGVARRLHTCAERLKAYLSGKIERLEELEEEIVSYGGSKGVNSYLALVSMNKLG